MHLLLFIFILLGSVNDPAGLKVGDKAPDFTGVDQHGQKITLCISEKALAAHLAHGDVVGDCVSESNNEFNKIADSKEENENSDSMDDDYFKIYPNPVEESSTIYFTTNITGKMTLSIFDQFGIKKSILFDGVNNSIENHAIKLKSKQLKKGIYFLTLQLSDGSIKTTKIIII